MQLPDNDLVQDQGLHIWAPGAAEGSMARHAGSDETKDRAAAAEIHAALLRLVDAPSTEAARSLVRRLFVNVISPRWVIDHVIAMLRNQPPADQDRLAEQLRRFLRRGEHRNKVKFARSWLARGGIAPV
jgi:hypothetical protein